VVAACLHSFHAAGRINDSLQLVTGYCLKDFQIVPATQAMNAFIGLAMGKMADFSPWGSVIILFSSGILAFGLAVYPFSWDSRNSTRRGHPLLTLLVLLPSLLGIFLMK
jgi:hypothetical protein